ncbi:hypothetical protein WMF31_39900 [Sorangium sp. So ce1036]|uniref:hypothetical protein n=1 Tax=Sorangium sp. So ce1036 TaxID=3133328 RepID=UPI003EFD5BC4
MDDRKVSGEGPSTGIEGEGDRTADRRYRKAVEQSVKRGDAEALGEEAARALDGPEGDALRDAEEAARGGRPG